MKYYHLIEIPKHPYTQQIDQCSEIIRYIYGTEPTSMVMFATSYRIFDVPEYHFILFCNDEYVTMVLLANQAGSLVGSWGHLSQLWKIITNKFRGWIRVTRQPMWYFE